MKRLFGGIEAGGTKFVCAIGTGPNDIRSQTQFATTEPRETLWKATRFFREYPDAENIAGIGIATFGPVNIDRDSPGYGCLMDTPKPGWSGVEIAGKMVRGLGIPVTVDTDVNGAALGENIWGAAQGLDTFVYLTAGTGIGGGGMVNGKLMHGLMHPEMGHIKIPHDKTKDPFKGSCQYHGDCLEGLACGKAMELRWAVSPENLPDNHPAWDLEAHYLACGLNNLICNLSPQRIILGGGLMKHPGLLFMIRDNVLRQLNGYLNIPQITEKIEEYIVAPGLGDFSGVLGAIALVEYGGE